MDDFGTMCLAFILDYVVNALNLRDPSLRAFKSHVTMLAAHYFTNGNSAGPARTRVNNHSCRVFARREDAELPPRALARLHQIGGCYL